MAPQTDGSSNAHLPTPVFTLVFTFLADHFGDMAKYFDNERKLPSSKIGVTSGDFSEPWLANALAGNGNKISLCLSFPKFPDDAIGYVFNIEKTGDAFCLSDITGKKVLSVGKLSELVAIVRHVSGVNYDANWQAEFQKLRNQITSER